MFDVRCLMSVFLSTQSHAAFRNNRLQKLQQSVFGGVTANEQMSVIRARRSLVAVAL